MTTFEQFATDRLRPLLRLAGAICQDTTLAEDLVQDVLIKVAQRWDYVNSRDDPDSYVRRMLINEHISWHRKWGRIVPRARIEPRDMVTDHAAVQADQDLLRHELSRLPRRQQLVLALRYYEGLSDPEIAEAMGCTAGTVRGYASRAIASLRLRAAAITGTDERPRR